jgi:Bacterial archaeo-eukaryotic release factor family 3
VEVSSRFCLLPLIEALSLMEPYLALTVSQNRTALYLGNTAGMREIPSPPGMPESLDELVNDEGAQHSEKPAHPGGTVTAHGRASRSGFEEENRERFLRAVAESIVPVFQEHKVYLVLMGVRELVLDLKVHLTDLQHVLVVEGNVDQFATNNLHELAQAAVRQASDQDRQGQAKRLEERPPNMLARGLDACLKAASAGRVETLFMKQGHVVQGSWNPDTLVCSETGSEPLMELLALSVLHHGGAVTVVDPGIPEEPVLAALRY